MKIENENGGEQGEKTDWHNRPTRLINYSDIDHYYTACSIITAGYLVLSGNGGFAYQISGAVLADALDIDSRNKFLRDAAETRIGIRSEWFEMFP